MHKTSPQARVVPPSPLRYIGKTLVSGRISLQCGFHVASLASTSRKGRRGYRLEYLHKTYAYPPVLGQEGSMVKVMYNSN